MGLLEQLKKNLAGTKPRLWTLRPEILLSDNIPQPLHGLAPRVILGPSWWNKTRREAYASTDQHCIACGVHKYKARSRQWLEGHELYRIDYKKGSSTYIETVPLCHYCHSYIHDGRLTWLLQTGKIHQGKFIAIIQHGDRVLSACGLKRMSRPQREVEFATLFRQGKIAPWSKWHLVLNGKKYKTKFKDLDHYNRVHNKADED